MDLRLSKDIEDIVILLDGCEVLEEQFNQSQGKVKTFLRDWFRENRDDLKEAVLSFLPSSSDGTMRNKNKRIFFMVLVCVENNKTIRNRSIGHCDCIPNA